MAIKREIAKFGQWIGIVVTIIAVIVRTVLFASLIWKARWAERLFRS